MRAIDHVSITVRDLKKALPFYAAVFGALGLRKVYERADAVGFGERNRQHDDDHTYLSVYQSDAARADPRRHWCFRAASAEEVRRFHFAGLAADGRDAGAPGLRVDYHPHYYAAFLEDPEGNRIEAVCHHGDAQ